MQTKLDESSTGKDKTNMSDYLNSSISKTNMPDYFNSSDNKEAEKEKARQLQIEHTMNLVIFSLV